jgi:hypothetical protein
MIEKLKNYLHPENENDTLIDPRWDALRRLENNN